MRDNVSSPAWKTYKIPKWVQSLDLLNLKYKQIRFSFKKKEEEEEAAFKRIILS